MKELLFFSFFTVLVLGSSCVTQPTIDSTISEEKKSITVISPNGDEQWQEGTSQTITWESTGIDKITIEAATGGKPLGVIASEINASQGSYDWKIPKGFVSNFGQEKSETMRIKIFDESNQNIFDENDNEFTIQKNN